MSEHVIRVFPRRTKATPTGDLVRTGRPFLWDEADRIEISVAFTWDLPLADQLAADWKHVAPVEVGGPATGAAGGDFVPGRYLKPGYVITSRGCPNRCWFCTVWRREGNEVRELPICAGNNVLDDNLLACSDAHIHAVFDMLEGQRAVEFTGGLEAARLQDWHVDRLAKIKPKQLFFAYDTEDDLEPLYEAGGKLLAAGFTRQSHALRCYVLCGYPGDTFRFATARFTHAGLAGFLPMAMLYRNDQGNTRPEWRGFQREWARPAITQRLMREARG